MSACISNIINIVHKFYFQLLLMVYGITIRHLQDLIHDLNCMCVLKINRIISVVWFLLVAFSDVTNAVANGQCSQLIVLLLGPITSGIAGMKTKLLSSLMMKWMLVLVH